MRSYTQLVGTTTANAYPGSFADLTQNNTVANVALGARLINDQHRYLLQRYFDNDSTFFTKTRGGETLTLTATLAADATSATLNSAWTGATTQQFVVFSNSNQRQVTFTQGQTAISWQVGLSATATATISTVGVQQYEIPANVSKIRNDTISVGQLVYTPAPVNSIGEWTLLNSLPYTSDIPNYFFIYRNQMGVWVVEFFPIPSSSGNIITFNYKSRVPDFSYADYSTGTVTGSLNSNSLTGTATSWSTLAVTGTDLSFANLMLSVTPNKGDGFWYPIQRFTDDTHVVLNLPLSYAPNVSGATYVIGQFPLLQEDFHDMLVYGALMVYFTSFVPDKDQFSMYKGLYDEKLKLLENYAGTKSVNVDLGSQPTPQNPNLFIFAPPN